MSTEPQGRPSRAGRPRVGDQIKIAFPADLLARIDETAAVFGMSRSAWIRAACEAALPRRAEGK